MHVKVLNSQHGDVFFQGETGPPGRPGFKGEDGNPVSECQLQAGGLVGGGGGGGVHSQWPLNHSTCTKQQYGVKALFLIPSTTRASFPVRQEPHSQYDKSLIPSTTRASFPVQESLIGVLHCPLCAGGDGSTWVAGGSRLPGSEGSTWCSGPQRTEGREGTHRGEGIAGEGRT